MRERLKKKEVGIACKGERDKGVNILRVEEELGLCTVRGKRGSVVE